MKLLEQLKADREKAQRDLQNLAQGQVMVQGVILYLNSKIQELEQKVQKKEGV